MRKTLPLTILLVLLWTSTLAGAQTVETEPEYTQVQSFMEFLFEYPRTTDKNIISSFNGHEWVLTPISSKNTYVMSFMTAADLLGNYAMSIIASHPPNTTGDPNTGPWCLESFLGFLTASNFKFRVGVYVIELDAIYNDYANRDIPVMEAMYLAKQRLNGQEIDLVAWRKK